MHVHWVIGNMLIRFLVRRGRSAVGRARAHPRIWQMRSVEVTTDGRASSPLLAGDGGCDAVNDVAEARCVRVKEKLTIEVHNTACDRETSKPVL